MTQATETPQQRNFPGDSSVFFVKVFQPGEYSTWLHQISPFQFSMTKLHSLKLSCSPLQMDGWNTTFLLGKPIFRGYVSFREGIQEVHSKCAFFGGGFSGSSSSSQVAKNGFDVLGSLPVYDVLEN